MLNPPIDSCQGNFFGCFTELYEKETDNYKGYYTRRGCFQENQQCNQEFCKKCESSNCNSKVFPLNRPRCLQCSNSDCSDANSEYCRVLLQNNNECVSLFDNGSLQVFSTSDSENSNIILILFILPSKNRGKCHSTNLLFEPPKNNTRTV